MKYVKAATVLPESLIAKFKSIYKVKQFTFQNKKQNIIDGVYTTGGRKQLDERNKAIKDAFKSGIAIHQLAEEYFLSGETIKKIVYSK